MDTDFTTLMDAARAYCLNGRYEEALRGYAKACAIKPDAAHAWCNRAGAAFLAGHHDEAASHYQHALTLNATLEEAQYGLVRVQLATRRWQDALTTLTVYPPPSESRHFSEWHYMRGVAFENMQDDAQAAEAYRVAVANHYAPAQKTLPRLMLAANKPMEAIDHFFGSFPQARVRWMFTEACMARYPHDPALHDRLARHFLAQHQFAYAARVAERACRSTPSLKPADWPSLKECVWFR